MTQASVNACFCERAKSVDAQLNDVYQQLLKRNSVETNFIDKLKISQRAWLAFRDAQLEAIFPDDTNPRAHVRISFYYVRVYGSGGVNDGSRQPVETYAEVSRG